jgi:hypothetical protein
MIVGPVAAAANSRGVGPVSSPATNPRVNMAEPASRNGSSIVPAANGNTIRVYPTRKSESHTNSRPTRLKGATTASTRS